MSTDLSLAHFGWLSLAGMAVVVAPGTPLWLVPTLGFAGHLIYEHSPDLQGRARPLLTQAGQQLRAALPAGSQEPRIKTQEPSALAPAQDDGVIAQSFNPSIAQSPHALLSTLEDHPHRLLIGHTRGGKTTLIHHLATTWAARGERVLVGDPDAAPGLWPGCEVRGSGDDIASIQEILTITREEVQARRQARAAGQRHFPPLHLVLDEAQDVLPALEGGLDLFEDIARRGGKLNVRLTIGVQDKQVATLGLSGKSHLLRNFQVADILKAQDGRRMAMVRDPESNRRLPIPIPNLPDPERLIVEQRKGSGKQAPRTEHQAPRTEREEYQASGIRHQVSGTPDPRSPAPDPRIGLLEALLAVPVSASVPTPHHTDTNTGTNTDTSHTRITVRDGANSGGATIYIHNQAHPPTVPRRRRRQVRGLEMRRRRRDHRATLAHRDAREAAQHRRKAELQAAYIERKARGLSYRRAYAELGGGAEETRRWWREAVPNPPPTPTAMS